MRLCTTITLHNAAKDFIKFVFEFYTQNFTRFNVLFHSFKDRRYKEYLVKISDRISKMQQQKSFKLIVQEQQLRSRGVKGQVISKANFEVFIYTKNRTKIFFYFCPRCLKWIKSKKEYKLLYILDDK